MATKKSELTRALVFETALKLFRQRGFDETSMRDIAEAAGLSLGAAYYYFRSKEEIVLQYYARVEERIAADEERLRAGATTLRERLLIAFSTKLAAVHRDRRIFGALVRHVADPKSPINLFSRETAAVRNAAIDTFRRAVAPELAALPPSAQRLLPPALWAAYLALLLYLFHDRSRGHARTDALVAQVVDLLAGLIPMLALPLAAPLLDRIATLVDEAALLPPPR
jgi:AcrR family transcriptional regulator